VLLDHQEFKVLLDHQEFKVLLDHQEFKDHLVLVIKGFKVFKVLLDLQEQQTVQRSTYSLVVSALELRRVLLLTKLKQ
jgi:hypothetical protein